MAAIEALMKKWIWCLALPALLAPSLEAAEKFSLRISYGAAQIAPSDLNDFLADFIRVRRDAGYVLAPDGLKSLKASDEFELTLSVPLGAHFSVFAAGGFIGAQQVGNDVGFTTADGTGNFLRNDRIRAFAARLGVSYAWPLSKIMTLRPHASVDGYWSSFQDDGSRSFGWSRWPEQTELEWTANTTAFNVGGTLGLGLDIAVWSKLSLSLDAGWRLARLSGFSGKYQETDFGLTSDIQDFRLSYFEQNVERLDSIYKMLNLPGSYGDGVTRGLRDAVLDMSGFYGSVGIKISF
jgi:hypothetical protein